MLSSGELDPAPYGGAAATLAPPPLNAAVARPPQATLLLADSVLPPTAGGGGDRSIDGVWRGYGFRRRARVWSFLDFFCLPNLFSHVAGLSDRPFLYAVAPAAYKKSDF